MAAPNVVEVIPGNSETDVILGTPIIVTFDQEIDATSITDATFCLTGPGTSEVVNARNLVSPSCAQRNPRARSRRRRGRGRIANVTLADLGVFSGPGWRWMLRQR